MTRFFKEFALVLNKSYGGFNLPEEYLKKHPELSKYDDGMDIRKDKELIKWIDANPDKTTLRVVRFFATSSSIKISEYDGLETVYYIFENIIKTA